MQRFVSDRKTYDAALRNLQVMAESTQRLKEETKRKYPSIAWRSIAGFRNILVHDYLGNIDDHMVWNIIRVDLPMLRDMLAKELPR